MATPDILVIQVEASGAYSQLAWQAPLSPPSGYFLDFYETYVREETSEADLGVYTVDADALRVEFTVTPYSEWLVVIGSVTICTSPYVQAHHEKHKDLHIDSVMLLA